MRHILVFLFCLLSFIAYADEESSLILGGSLPFTSQTQYYRYAPAYIQSRHQYQARNRALNQATRTSPYSRHLSANFRPRGYLSAPEYLQKSHSTRQTHIADTISNEDLSKIISSQTEAIKALSEAIKDLDKRVNDIQGRLP